MRQPCATVEVTRRIAAPARQLYDLVSDLPRMGEWSPENRGGDWIDGATGPVVGARFKGQNRNPDTGVKWSTVARVLEAEPGRRFSFIIDFLVGRNLVRWTYSFEQDDDGTTLVTEKWDDLRWPWFAKLISLAGRIGDRADHYQRGMEATLANLAAAAESSDRSGEDSS